MGMVRRISALALIVALSLIGIPLPAHAAGEESPPLTINGHLLSQVLSRTAFGDPIPLAGLFGQETGQINGVASDREGKPLAEHTVRATRVFTLANTATEATQSAGTTTTDAAGQFSFMGLQASDYIVEVLSGEEVVARASVTLAEGAMQASGISVAPPAAEPESEPGWWSRQSTPRKVLLGVGIFFGAIFVYGIACTTSGSCTG